MFANTVTLGTVSSPGTGQSDLSVGLLSFLSRVNYSYKDKYLFMASYRKDGSSYFAEGHKWGGFPAASIGWVLSKESFLSNVNTINRLALRASYGATGNNNIDPFLYDTNLNSSAYLTGAGTGTVTNGLANNSKVNSNPDISWERTFSTNFGLDLALLKNRITMSIDVYQSKTEKLLLNQSTLLITGSSSTITNAGSLRNKGIELELSSVNVKNKNFSWSTDFNISHVKNEILNLDGKTQIISNQIDGSTRAGLNNYAFVGQPLVSFFGYKTDGVWTSIQQITDAKLTTPVAGALQVGGLKIVDVNGAVLGDGKPNGIIDANDKTNLGNPYPDFTWGFTNKFTCKNFDLSFTLQGSQGGKLINGDSFYNETKTNNLNYTANRWVSPGNPGDGNTPYVTNGVNWFLTDKAVQDASYMSLREMNIGFNFRKETLKSIGLSTLRLSLSGQNLYFLANKNYSGINIEARSTQSPPDPLADGYQRGAYPMQRTVLAGIEIGL
jgi:TonB-linked SusC/RagA family outer membrane protein